jgi:hypothetical protein
MPQKAERTLDLGDPSGLTRLSNEINSTQFIPVPVFLDRYFRGHI